MSQRCEQRQRQADEEEYVDLLARFREWCVKQDVSFLVGMARAVCKAMGEKPPRPPGVVGAEELREKKTEFARKKLAARVAAAAMRAEVRAAVQAEATEKP